MQFYRFEFNNKRKKNEYKKINYMYFIYLQNRQKHLIERYKRNRSETGSDNHNKPKISSNRIIEQAKPKNKTCDGTQHIPNTYLKNNQENIARDVCLYLVIQIDVFMLRVIFRKSLYTKQTKKMKKHTPHNIHP